MSCAIPEGPAGNDPQCPPINVTKALERMMGDAVFLETIIQQFLTDVPQQLEEIRQALDSQDAETLQHKAHRLKGSAANLGADSVAAAALRLEQIGRQGNLQDGCEALDMLNGHIADLKEYIAHEDCFSRRS